MNKILSIEIENLTDQALDFYTALPLEGGCNLLSCYSNNRSEVKENPSWQDMIDATELLSFDDDRHIFIEGFFLRNDGNIEVLLGS